MAETASEMLTVTVNGEVRQVGLGETVLDILRLVDAPNAGVAVERNRAIVPKSLHATTPLEDGDTIEIVQFVGGG